MGIERLDAYTIVERLQAALLIGGITFAVTTALVIIFVMWRHMK